MTEQALAAEQHMPQPEPTPRSPVDRVKDAVVGFLKSRLPGEKTRRSMEIVDKLTSHLPPERQELAAKLRPIVEKSLFAGNVVGTTAEAVLAATLVLGGAVVIKEALTIVPVDTSGLIKRKGFGGVWKDINVGGMPRSLLSVLVGKSSPDLKVSPRIDGSNDVSGIDAATAITKPRPIPSTAPQSKITRADVVDDHNFRSTIHTSSPQQPTFTPLPTSHEVNTTPYHINFDLNHTDHLKPDPHKQMHYQGKSWYRGGGFTDFVDSDMPNDLSLQDGDSEGIHYRSWSPGNERRKEPNPQTYVVRSLAWEGMTYLGLSTRATEALRDIQLGFEPRGGRPFDHIQWYPVATKTFFNLIQHGYPLGSLLLPKNWTQILYEARDERGGSRNLIVPGPEPIDLHAINGELFWNTELFKRDAIKVLLSEIFVSLLDQNLRRLDVVANLGLTKRDKLKIWEAVHTLLLNTPAYKPDFPINFFADPIPCAAGLVFRAPDEPMVGDYARLKSRELRFGGQPTSKLSEQIAKNLDRIFVRGTWTGAMKRWSEFAKKTHL